MLRDAKNSIQLSALNIASHNSFFNLSSCIFDLSFNMVIFSRNEKKITPSLTLRARGQYFCA